MGSGVSGRRGGRAAGLTAGLLLLLAGCTVPGGAVVAEVDADAWTQPAVLRLPNADTLGRYDWQLFLRCDDRMQADTFTLCITVLTPDSLRFVERLPVRVPAQAVPAPLMRPIEIDYRRQVRLARTGSYRLLVRPLRPLQGVEAVGIQTVKCD